MIQFSISLSANQIACLQSVAAYEEGISDQVWGTNRFWWAGKHILFSERLIEIVEKEIPEEEYQRIKHKQDVKLSEGRGSVYLDRKVRLWRVTEKGRLLLRVIELDVADYAKTIEETKTLMIVKMEETDKKGTQGS